MCPNRLSAGNFYLRINTKYLLNKAKSRRGKKIIPSSIRVILRNPAYLGRYSYTFQEKNVTIDLPALINRKRWESIQRKANDNFAAGTRSRNYPLDDPFILRDTLACGECGHGIMAIKVNKRTGNEQARYYACFLRQARQAQRDTRNVKEGRPKDCHLPFIPAERLEDQVKGIILNHFMFPQNLKEQTGDLDKRGLESKLRSGQIRLGRLEAKRQEYWDLFNEGQIDKEQITKQENILKGQIEGLKEEIGETEKNLSKIISRNEDLNHLTETVSQIKALGSSIDKAIAKLTNQQWKELIKTGLEGERLRISIARRWDVVDDMKGLTAKQLNEPLYREVPGGKVPDWKIEGDWNFKLDRIAQYLQPLIKLNNRYYGIQP